MSALNRRFGISYTVSPTGLECSMTGYSRVIQQIVQLLMVLVTLGLNAVTSFIPQNLQKAVMYVYNFLTSSGNWIGYLVAATYYVLRELTYGWIFCNITGYLAYVPLYLSQLINFVNK